jgi:heptaprenylglyceryl phosphate synthase
MTIASSLKEPLEGANVIVTGTTLEEVKDLKKLLTKIIKSIEE